MTTQHLRSVLLLMATSGLLAACVEKSPAPVESPAGSSGNAPRANAPRSAAPKSFNGTVDLSSLDLTNVVQASGRPVVDKSAGGNKISLGKQTYNRGIGVQAASRMIIKLNGGATRFSATVGVDDEVAGMTGGTMTFSVVGDGRQLFPPGAINGGRGGRGGRGGPPPVSAADAPQKIDVDVSNIRVLVLETNPGNDGTTNDHGDWADAKLVVNGAMPEIVAPSKEEPIVLTPASPNTPRINSAKIFGVRPGHPILYTVAATGQRPMTFSAEGLPAGVTLNPATGVLGGSTTATGAHRIVFHATNTLGKADMTFNLQVGDTITLTPQLGWNSWNCFGSSVTSEKVKAATDAMVNSGLIDHGWSYINIDDFWEKNGNSARTNPDFAGPARDDKGVILPNARFSDMKELADYIHSKGLKAGLYSSPGPTTCGGCTASYQHETQDVMTWAGWGYDYIKYDWCSYGNQNIQQAERARVAAEGRPPLNPRQAAMEPYRILGEALKKADRDIVYSLCQYGNQSVWEWGAEVGGNSWRTTGDIQGNWRSVTTLMDQQVGHEKFAGPGHWNDPDMLVVGRTAIGSGNNPTQGLSANEMYTHYSAWIMLNSPMLIGCDMTKMDAFTLGLLSNDEVLALNQDVLGQQAKRMVPPTPETGVAPPAGMFQVYAKNLSDGSKAIAIFSRLEIDETFPVKWSDIGITGRQQVRDLWRQKDLGAMNGEFAPVVPRHGVVLVKMTPAK